MVHMVHLQANVDGGQSPGTLYEWEFILMCAASRGLHAFVHCRG